MSYRIIEKGDTTKTSEYTYKCIECESVRTESYRISGDKPEKLECVCGGDMVRCYDSIAFPFINGRMDANSANYWQKGKSATEIAKVLSNESEPY